MKQPRMVIKNSDLTETNCVECKKKIELGLPMYIDDKNGKTYCTWACFDKDLEDENDNKG